MGVNLPAHLVVIKSTEQYVNGAYCDYSESSILQMMGRAGRPQFDTSATAVIMTKQNQKARFNNLCNTHVSTKHNFFRQNTIIWLEASNL